MKHLVLLFVLACSSGSAFTQTTTRFIPYRKAFLWGYCDTSKQMLIKAQFQQAFPFNEQHRAIVKVREHYVLIDTFGNVKSDSFESFGEIKEGLMPVIQNKKAGYMTPEGIITIACRYDFAEPFSEGLAVVYTNGRAGVIDKSGNYIVTPRYTATSRTYSSSRLLVTENGQNLFIDHLGKQLELEPDLLPSGGFSEGFAPAYKRKINGPRDTAYHLVYINPAGKIVFDSLFDHSSYLEYMPFNAGKAGLEVVYEVHKGYYYLDTFGKLSKEYSGIQPFSEGLALSVEGYYMSDNYIIDEQYNIQGKVTGRVTNAGAFHQGLLFVGCDPTGEKNIRYGYVNKRGRIIIPYQYENASDFKNGIAAVMHNGYWGYIDLKGKEYWE